MIAALDRFDAANYLLLSLRQAPRWAVEETRASAINALIGQNGI